MIKLSLYKSLLDISNGILESNKILREALKHPVINQWDIELINKFLTKTNDDLDWIFLDELAKAIKLYDDEFNTETMISLLPNEFKIILDKSF